MKKKHVGIVVGILGILAAAVFIYYRWQTSGFNWTQFANAFTGIRWNWMVLALTSVLFTYVGRAFRWQLMLLPINPQARLLRVLVATCIGFTAVVLFGRAGEPVRPFLIAKREGVSFSSQIAAWLVERILDVLMILVIFGIALSQISRSSFQPGPAFAATLKAAGYIAGFAGAACLMLLIALRQFQGRLRERLIDALGFLPDTLRTRIQGFLTSFEQGMECTRNPVFIWKLVGYSALEWLVIVGAFFCTFKAFPATEAFTLNDVVIALGFIAFGSAIQLPGIGGGMQIAAAVVLTQFFGLSLEVASSIALVLWLVNFVSIVPVGLGLAFHEGIKWRNLREITETTSGLDL